MDANSVMRLFDGRKELVSLQEARERGLKRYYTGVPCKNGHDCEKTTNNQGCIECSRINRAKCSYRGDPDGFSAWEADHKLKDKVSLLKAEARKEGKKRFFTGVPCLNGHVADRFVSNGSCVDCTYAADIRTKEDHAEKAKRMWAKHREKRSAENKAAYAANTEYHKARAKAWMQANPERVRQRNLLRWHLKRSLDGNFSKSDLDRIRSEQRDKCAFCKSKLSGRGSLDHIVPISKGGTNEPRNLQWLCKPCNSSKQAHDQIDWARSRGLLL